MHHYDSSMDLNTLKQVYIREVDALKASLLEGASWEEMREVRNRVKTLESLLFKMIRSQNAALAKENDNN